MTSSTALAVAAALVALAFGMSTFERWLARGRRHELAWSVALGLFAVAAAAMAAGAAGGWNGPVFRVFYLFGAIADVPVLALGTIWLLWPRRAQAWTWVVVAGGAFAAGVLAVAPFRHVPTGAVLPQGSAVFGPWPRVLAAVASGAGAIVVWGGAVWSAWRFWRAGGAARLVGANALIALGTVVLGASGLLNSVAGAMTAFSVSLLAGISIVFVGFLVAAAPAAPLAKGELTSGARPDGPPGPPGPLGPPGEQVSSGSGAAPSPPRSGATPART